jgi:hypothetical protein
MTSLQLQHDGRPATPLGLPDYGALLREYAATPDGLGGAQLAAVLADIGQGAGRWRPAHPHSWRQRSCHHQQQQQGMMMATLEADLLVTEVVVWQQHMRTAQLVLPPLLLLQLPLLQLPLLQLPPQACWQVHHHLLVLQQQQLMLLLPLLAQQDAAATTTPHCCRVMVLPQQLLLLLLPPMVMAARIKMHPKMMPRRARRR